VRVPVPALRLERARERVPASDSIAAALTLHPEDKARLGPTVIVWVEGGLVQGVESDGRVRVIVCDFDCTVEEQAARVDGRPCVVFEWDPPDKPGEEFGDVIELLDAQKEGS